MKCKKCTAELTRDEKRNCLVCLECSPPQATAPEPEEKDMSNYVDKPWTDERVKKIFKSMFPDAFRAEMENYMMPKVTVMDPATPVTTTGRVEPREPDAAPTDKEIDGHLSAIVHAKQEAMKEKTWRDEAKELGIDLYDKEQKRPRKKDDVLADIASKTKEPALAGDI